MANKTVSEMKSTFLFAVENLMPDPQGEARTGHFRWRNERVKALFPSLIICLSAILFALNPLVRLGLLYAIFFAFGSEACPIYMFKLEMVSLNPTHGEVK